MTTQAGIERIAGFQKFLIDIKFLWLEQMLEVRKNWYWYLIFSLFLPVAMVFGFARMGSGLTDQRGLIYIVSGSAIFAAVSDSLYTMAVRIGSMKQNGMLIYYASLPISKAAFIIAVMLSRLTVTLFSMLVPIVFGAWFYDLDISLNLWLVILLPFTALAMSLIGMALGSFVRSLELIQAVVNALLFALVMVAPIFIPPEALPVPLRILGYFLPPTYAAAALRAALTGAIDSTLYLNLGVLLLLVVAGFFAINRWLTWQLK